MSGIRKYKTPAGELRWQADVADRRRGIPRTKRTFGTRKEAEDWLAAVHRDAHNRLLGHRPRYLVGEALTRYLDEESPRKRAADKDRHNASVLRWPIWMEGRWVRLEEASLDEAAVVLAAWVADLRLIQRRRYIGAALYHLRPGPAGEPAWFHQPDPNAHGGRPQPRRLVTERELLAQLDAPGGRGPYPSATLRVRQALIARVLRVAWRRWDWIDRDPAARIEYEKPSPGRLRQLDGHQLAALVAAAEGARRPGGEPDPAAPHFADLILGAAWIGWRRANVTGLEWPRVVFPVWQEEAGQRIEVQPGLLWVDGDKTKNEQPLAQPMSARVQRLLERRWELRGTSPGYVFHDGTGAPWGDFRKRWCTALRTAGIDPDFHWHDLRHSWATELLHAGATDRELQELGGWKDARMVRRYSHMRVEHLRGAVNLPETPR